MKTLGNALFLVLALAASMLPLAWFGLPNTSSDLEITILGRTLASRLFWEHKIFGLYAELPVAYNPGMNLNTQTHGIPNSAGFLFVTPSARVNVFSGDSVTPWVSFGGGYGRWQQSSNLNFYGTNPGPASKNTGAIQFGGGLDVWFWPRWGGRFEFRDFFAGKPDLNLQTTGSWQHNYYVGAGIMHRF